MSIIVTAVTSRGDIGFTMCSYQCPTTDLVSAFMQVVIIFFLLPVAC